MNFYLYVPNNGSGKLELTFAEPWHLVATHFIKSVKPLFVAADRVCLRRKYSWICCGTLCFVHLSEIILQRSYELNFHFPISAEGFDQKGSQSLYVIYSWNAKMWNNHQKGNFRGNTTFQKLLWINNITFKDQMTIVLMDGFINMVCELMANLEFHS